ncbi:MAG: hypothetical protein M5U08_20685 [Burkholderiales bacterium]|nr:hypothetical protein [Burkholderiales bacterium]
MRTLFVAAFRVALTALAAMLAGGVVAAPPYNLTLSGASPGGLWSTVGAAFNASVAAAYPGSTITYQTSGGGLANAQLLADKKVPIGIINDFELLVAVRGRSRSRRRSRICASWCAATRRRRGSRCCTCWSPSRSPSSTASRRSKT